MPHRTILQIGHEHATKLWAWSMIDDKVVSRSVASDRYPVRMP